MVQPSEQTLLLQSLSPSCFMKYSISLFLFAVIIGDTAPVYIIPQYVWMEPVVGVLTLGALFWLIAGRLRDAGRPIWWCVGLALAFPVLQLVTMSLLKPDVSFSSNMSVDYLREVFWHHMIAKTISWSSMTLLLMALRPGNARS